MMEPEEGAFLPLPKCSAVRVPLRAEQWPCGALRASFLRALLADGFFRFCRNGSLHAELQKANTLGAGADSCRGWARILKEQIQTQNDLEKLEE